MSLEVTIQENTNVMRDLIAALLMNKPQLGEGVRIVDAAPGVDKVIKAQKEVDAKKPVKAVEQIHTPDTPVTTSGKPSTPAPATESADAVELKPWHEKTAALFAELNGKAPELAQVQKAVLGINTHCGREQATALLSRFGAQAISPKPDKKGLDESQYPEVFALALEVLAGRVDATESLTETFNKLNAAVSE